VLRTTYVAENRLKSRETTRTSPAGWLTRRSLDSCQDNIDSYRPSTIYTVYGQWYLHLAFVDSKRSSTITHAISLEILIS